ncbi:helix-turn-helix transcriptional regulator [Microbacterium oxydans]|uniref:helix-turn-helix transcriptional regulator n=1 Tax=Microbacterium oxydans TaxID=82380 RepID=UPI0024AE4008|nr:LuxR C-terminal-related transcriptional regulator [Microbacterium oxydans]
MVHSRDQFFAQAIGVIGNGGSVDIVGDRGAGRTTLWERLRSHFLNENWFILTLSGVPSFKSYPLVALSVAGVTAAREGRPSAIAACVDEIAERTRQERAAIFIDDWNDLDDASWGVMTAVQRRHGVPIVITRIKSADARHTPGGLAAASMALTYTIDLPSFRYDELDEALTARLGAPIDPAALSRVYAKTGGNVGLAFALVDTAVREQRLESKDGSWVATRDLWSNALVTMVESLLEHLTPEQRDRLETLSLLGNVDLAAVEPLVSIRTLEELEKQSLVELYAAGGRFLVNVKPPLVVEYFRHVSHPARRLRLTQALHEDLMVSGIEEIDVSTDEGGHMAGFVRFVHEQRRARLLVARAEWNRTGSRGAAVDYVRTLVASAARLDEIDAVLAASENAPAEDALTVEWHVLKAEHAAFAHHEPARAVADLRAAAGSLGPLGAILLARAVEIEDALIGNGRLTTLPTIDEDLPTAARSAVHRAHATVLTARGDIVGSRAHIDAIRSETLAPLEPATAMIAGLNDLCDGLFRKSAEDAARGMEEARERFDPIGMRVHGYLAVAGGVLAGRFTDVEQVLDTLYAIGEPFHEPPFTQLTFDITSAVLASRRGNKRLVAQRVADFERNSLPDGPWVGTSRAYAYAQIAASAGDFPRAGDILDDAAERLWERGALVASMLASLVSLELAPTPGKVDTVTKRIPQVPAEVARTHFLFATSVASGDPQQMLAAGEDLAARGRASMALIAVRAAADKLTQTGDQVGADHALARFEALRAGLATDEYDLARYKSVVIDLTVREREVARMAASGMTNQQIADALTLSVRTVETHLHRLMRKTGTERRSQLREYLEYEASR